METTLILGAVTSAESTTTLTVDENGRVEKDSENIMAEALSTTIATGTTLGIAKLNQAVTAKKIQEKSATEYVASLSNEELERALISLELLEEDYSSNLDIKSK